ncbi:serine kinase [Croceicoccus sp. F390]|uniref:Serine kinase n=1 Tax=Croceicoccus esteveae TaxID=3075597 RepID=A0ABU2ZG54_9SPHN|nr:serine kinase [Croceicoccus sp. F390]MDT0575570.1 serine kinase [Croceicoccus sp. F390]
MMCTPGAADGNRTVRDECVPHQATALAIARRAILIEGDPGAGKSSLALGLIDRGAVLIGDDGVLLCRRNGMLWAVPHPNTRGMIEVRNVGIITLPVTEAPVALVIRLDVQAPRYVEQAPQVVRAATVLPCISLSPDAANLPIRTELALSLHGKLARTVAMGKDGSVPAGGSHDLGKG